MIRIFFSCATFLSVSALAHSQVIDEIGAQVGDNIILVSEIEELKLQTESGFRDPVSCSYLEALMYEKLLLRQAELDSILIPDATVDTEMEARLRSIERSMNGHTDESGNPVTIESFYGKTRMQLKEEFRPAIRRHLLTMEVERRITENVTVSPAEVTAFFHRQPFDSLPFINAQLVFQQLVIVPEVTRQDKQTAYEKLVGIRRQIVEEGKDFPAMTRIHSANTVTAQLGGKTEGTRGMYPKAFESVVFSLQRGEVSPVFELADGWHILKMETRSGDDYVVYDLLVAVQPTRENLLAASSRMQECIAALKSGKLSWEQAVQMYSNDPATKAGNGMVADPFTDQLRWDVEHLGMSDQELFHQLNVLSPGELTAPSFYDDPVAGSSVLRIARLVERTPPHSANLNDDYELIRAAAENEKKQQAIAAWTVLQINEVYVRINDAYASCDFRNRWVP